MLQSLSCNMVATTLASGAVGLFYAHRTYKPNPQIEDLTDEQFAKFVALVPELAKINNDHHQDLILGGSAALKIYTGRDFEVDDVDVMLRSRETSNEIAMRHPNVTLEQDQAYFKSLFPEVADKIVTKLARDSDKSVVSNEGLEEKFDENIFGTINLSLPSYPKMQFVMINNIFSNGKRLINWYDKVSDLPVFIYYDTGLQTWRWYVRDPYAAKLSKYGFLRSSSFHHDYRKDKYRNKGFWLV